MNKLIEILGNIKSGELLRVTQTLTKEFGEASSSPDAWSFAARHLRQAGYLDLSRAIYLRLMQSGYLSHEVGFNLIQSALDNNQTEEAAELAQRLVSRSGLGGDLTTEVGEVAARALLPVDPEKTLSILDKLALDGTNANLLRVDALRKTERLNEALDLINGPLAALTDTDPRFLSRRARLREQLGDWKAAYDDYDRLVTDFGDSQACVALIRILQRQEKHGEIKHALAKCLVHVQDHAALLRIATQLNDAHLSETLVARALDSVGGQSFWDQATRTMLDQCKTSLVSAGYLGMAVYIEQVDRETNGAAADQTILRILKSISGGVISTLLNPAPLSTLSQIFSSDVAERLIRHGIARSTHRSETATTANRPRIMLVNATLAAGGAERQFMLFIESLILAGVAADDLHVCLFSLTNDRGHDHFRPWLDDLGVPYTDLSTLHVPETSLEQAGFSLLLPQTLRQDVARLQIVVQQMRPEIIHGWQDRSSLAAAWVGQENHTRQIVMSARNMQPEKRNMQLDYAKPLMKAFLGFDNVRLSANSYAGGRDYEEWLGLASGDVSVILNVIKSSSIPLQPSSKPRQSSKPPKKARGLILGGVFRFAHNKRPMLWLEVFKGLVDRADFPVKAVLVGAGPLKAAARQWSEENGLSALIEWREPRAQPGEIYAGMNALLLMSRIEGTPNVVLEAQASGLPVAACDVGGVKEATLLHESNARENDNLLLPTAVSADEATQQMLEWWPKVCRSDPEERRRRILEAYDITAVPAAALALYGLKGN